MQTTRHDFPKVVRDFFDAAVAARHVDATGIAVLALNHEGNAHGMVEEIISYAYSNRYTLPTDGTHEKYVEAFNAVQEAGY